jgi:hypothetical protein
VNCLHVPNDYDILTAGIGLRSLAVELTYQDGSLSEIKNFRRS